MEADKQPNAWQKIGAKSGTNLPSHLGSTGVRRPVQADVTTVRSMTPNPELRFLGTNLHVN